MFIRGLKVVVFILAIYIAIGTLVLGSEVPFVSTIAEMMIEEKRYYESREYIGEFTISHYCGCRICNGKWYGYPAANGEPLQDGYTIAVDPSVIPLGTYVDIEGYGIRKAQDTGSKIKGNRIDIYINDHKRCLELGVIKNVVVYEFFKGE